MKFSHRSRIGALLALVAWVAWAPAEAADYQVYRQGVCNGTICKVSFDLVPVGKKLRVTHASCYARVTTQPSFNTGNLYAMQLLLLNSKGGVAHAQTLSASRNGEFPGNPGYTSVYQGHNGVRMVVAAGQRVQGYAQISEGRFDQVACHVSGDLT
jgi:hypothetical protein